MITLALLITAVTGARADQLASSYSSNATLNAVTVSASMEVTIATGVTVTINNGLNITSGTLTVKGPGTLVVNGKAGSNGASGWEGSNGGNGGVAISGNIIVQGGATVTATGGNGGNGGSGALKAGTGGTGGNAFAGTLTYKSGTVTANGGSGGSGGYIDDEEKYASSGSAGKAFANDVDFTQTTGYSVTDGTSTIGSVLNQTKVVISGGTDPSASSGPEVAWDKATKTGSFKMPGGNVTLEPEYYPQAVLAAAPTAINNVPATTDGAIVEAGTVMNIGETTTAQGTVMYYVSPTALDDAALLALAADQWTAGVPTAAGLAQGQAHVYYYVRGNDSDTDEEVFSDGDILATNALTVTIAAEPTYAVTFAEGVNPEPPAEPEWTASPAAGVTKGQTVTVTYTGTKKVIGVKAEKKAKAPAGPITVTWNNDDITGTGKSFTKDGVTITAGNIDFTDKNFENGTFTTTLGNFTKIEVTTGIWLASGTGWSGSGQSGTWTGTPASSVSFSEGIVGMGAGTTKFVFTIEPTN